MVLRIKGDKDRLARSRRQMLEELRAWESLDNVQRIRTSAQSFNVRNSNVPRVRLFGDLRRRPLRYRDRVGHQLLD
jgi:hypothetical protein